MLAVLRRMNAGPITGPTSNSTEHVEDDRTPASTMLMSSPTPLREEGLRTARTPNHTHCLCLGCMRTTEKKTSCR